MMSQIKKINPKIEWPPSFVNYYIPLTLYQIEFEQYHATKASLELEIAMAVGYTSSYNTTKVIVKNQ